MKTWRITYTDGTSEVVDGFTVQAHDGVLMIEQGNASYNRRPRYWPLTSVRSWEEVR